ncbi:hypothetical protein HOY80DRAFT_1139496 [Tuber brumale]|nr:hypothetical protein HOY80DRAFT_1139496 [Tuber brumale]
MNSTRNNRRTQVTGTYPAAGQGIPPGEGSNAPNYVIGPSGAAWIKPGSSQPPDLSFDTARHRRITHALLTEWGRRDLIPTQAPADIKDPVILWEHMDRESSKRIERNRLLYPKRLSPVDETLFMTPCKKAVIPTYLRTRIANMYRKESDGNMDSVADEPQVATAGGSGKLILFRLGGDRPGKPRHRLDLWKPDFCRRGN